MFGRKVIYGGLAALFAVLTAVSLILNFGGRTGVQKSLTAQEVRELEGARRKLADAASSKTRTDKSLDDVERKRLLERIEALEAKQMRSGWVSEVVSSASDIVGMLSALLSLLFTWLAYRLAQRSSPGANSEGSAQV